MARDPWFTMLWTGRRSKSSAITVIVVSVLFGVFSFGTAFYSEPGGWLRWFWIVLGLFWVLRLLSVSATVVWRSRQ